MDSRYEEQLAYSPEQLWNMGNDTK